MAQNNIVENEKSYRQKYQRALADLISGRPVAYYPRLAHVVGGVKAAVMLSQLLYWNGDEKVTKEKDGWFYKSIEEMEVETGLVKLEQATARKALSAIGCVEIKLTGWPRKWYYKVDLDALGDLLVGWVSHPTVKPSNGKASQRESQPTRKPANGKTSQPENQPMRKPLNGEPLQSSVGNPPNIGWESQPTTEERINVLNTEITPENTTETTSSSYLPSPSKPGGREEEVSFKILDSRLISKILSLGVFSNMLPEIDSSGWTANELNALADSVKNGAEPGGLFMFRLRHGRKPKVATIQEKYLPVDVQRQMNAANLYRPFQETCQTIIGASIPGIKMVELDAAGKLQILCTDADYEIIEPHLEKITAQLSIHDVTEIECLEPA